MVKRVFQVVHDLNLAGTETVFMNWYRNIDRNLLQFDFAVDKDYYTPLVEEIKQKGGRIFVIPSGKGMLGKIRFYRKLYCVLKENGPYIAFHTHSLWWCFADCFIAQLAGIKKRFSISHFADGAGPRKYRLLRPFFYFLINRCFVTNRLAVSKQAGYKLYGEKAKYTIVKNGIDLTRFAFNSAKRAKKRKEMLLEDNFVIGHIGRFEKQKNHNFLLDIFAEIYKQDNTARLVLLGVGSLMNAIKQKAKDLHLENAVLFMGSRNDIEDFYQIFDAFVFPSLFEGLGIVAIECQCSGLSCFL